jgi:hypothetical protein
MGGERGLFHSEQPRAYDYLSAASYRLAAL